MARLVDKGRQLDALAACIIGSKQLKKLAKKWQVSPSAIYHLATSATKRLAKELQTVS